MRTLPNCNSFFSKQGTSQEVCTGIFDGTGNLTHYNWDPNKLHPYTVIYNAIVLLATCLMAFIEIGRHRIKLSKPIGIGIQPPKNLESALLNFALIALIVLNHTSHNFYFKK